MEIQPRCPDHDVRTARPPVHPPCRAARHGFPSADEHMTNYHDFCRSILAEAVRVPRPAGPLRAETLATVRYEKPPGKQIQIDFGERRVSMAGESTKVFLVAATRGARGGPTSRRSGTRVGALGSRAWRAPFGTSAARHGRCRPNARAGLPQAVAQIGRSRRDAHSTGRSNAADGEVTSPGFRGRSSDGIVTTVCGADPLGPPERP